MAAGDEYEIRVMSRGDLERALGWAVPRQPMKKPEESAAWNVRASSRPGFQRSSADDAATGDSIFLALAARARGETLFLDAPEPNQPALLLAERYGLKPVFETARMYTGEPPGIDLACVFGVTTFELG